jgi:hypothetical protein
MKIRDRIASNNLKNQGNFEFQIGTKYSFYVREKEILGYNKAFPRKIGSIHFHCMKIVFLLMHSPYSLIELERCRNQQPSSLGINRR